MHPGATFIRLYGKHTLVHLADAGFDVGTGNCSDADLEAYSVSSDLSGCCSLCRHVGCSCLHDTHFNLAVRLFSFTLWPCSRHLRQNPFLIRNDNLSLRGILRSSWQELRSWGPLHLAHGLLVVFLDVAEESLTSVNSDLTWSRPPRPGPLLRFLFLSSLSCLLTFYIRKYR